MILCITFDPDTNVVLAIQNKILLCVVTREY